MLHFCCFVGKNPGHSLGPEALPLGQDRMRAQQQWTGSPRIPREPQIRRCRIVHGGDTAVGHDDEPCETRRGARQHTNLTLPELASATEPAPELCARIETI